MWHFFSKTLALYQLKHTTLETTVKNYQMLSMRIMHLIQILVTKKAYLHSNSVPCLDVKHQGKNKTAPVQNV